MRSQVRDFFSSIDSWQDASAAATVLALVIAGFTLLLTRSQWRETREARLDQARQAVEIARAQSRPYVVIDFDFSFSGFVQLEIENLGQTAARDVRFEFDPPLYSTFDDETGQGRNKVPIAELALWKGIPTLPPRRVSKVLFDRHTRFELAKTDQRLANRFTATITYRGDVDDETYMDEFVLDFEVVRKPELVPVTVKNAVKELEKIGKALSAFTNDAKPIRVVAETDDVRSARRRREFEEWSTAQDGAGAVPADTVIHLAPPKASEETLHEPPDTPAESTPESTSAIVEETTARPN